MPYRDYYGKTGRVWNVTQGAVGVEVFRQVSNRLRTKRFHVRIEHIRHSKCKAEHIKRVKENEAAKEEAKKTGKKTAILKRKPEGSKKGYVVQKKACRKIRPMWE